MGGRTSWVAPGHGTSLRQLAIFFGRWVPVSITDEQMDALTSLLLLDEGIADERDRDRVEVVLRRVERHGKDGGA